LKATIAEISLKKRRANVGQGSAPDEGTASALSTGFDLASQELATDIRKWANYFGLFHGLFVNPEDFKADLRPAFRSDDLVRWSTPENQARGITAELYEVIPEKYHDLMALSGSQTKHKSFVSDVNPCFFTYLNSY